VPAVELSANSLFSNKERLLALFLLSQRRSEKYKGVNSVIKDGFYYCRCGQKIFKVLPETVLLNHVAYCKKCKTEQLVSIVYGKEITIKEKETTKK
jgi:hypothetical protein